MDSDDIGTPELARTLSKLDETVRDQFKTLNTRLDAQRYVTIELYQSENKTQNERILSLEERYKNAARVAAGAVLAVIIPIILATIRIYSGGS